MKAISLHQPYASLIAAGIKTLETRSRAIHYRGEIAIHAAKRWTDAQRQTWARFHSGWRDAFPRLSGDHSFPPLGVVVAVVEVTACVRFERGDLEAGRITQADVWTGDTSLGRYGWRLEGVRALAEPLPLVGRQSLWTLSPALAAEVLARASGGGTKLTDKHRQIVEHSLGLDRGRGTKKPYRNYFCAGPGGPDRAACEDLAARGLMSAGHTINDGRDRYFFVTEAGAAAVGHELPKEATFRIQDPSISRRHCQISNTPRGVLIADLGSSNGTYVNSQRLQAGWAQLSPGDHRS